MDLLFGPGRDGVSAPPVSRRTMGRPPGPVRDPGAIGVRYALHGAGRSDQGVLSSLYGSPTGLRLGRDCESFTAPIGSPARPRASCIALRGCVAMVSVLASRSRASFSKRLSTKGRQGRIRIVDGHDKSLDSQAGVNAAVADVPSLTPRMKGSRGATVEPTGRPSRGQERPSIERMNHQSRTSETARTTANAAWAAPTKTEPHGLAA